MAVNLFVGGVAALRRSSRRAALLRMTNVDAVRMFAAAVEAGVVIGDPNNHYMQIVQPGEAIWIHELDTTVFRQMGPEKLKNPLQQSTTTGAARKALAVTLGLTAFTDAARHSAVRARGFHASNNAQVEEVEKEAVFKDGIVCSP
ncbi:hypothetical protein HDV05_001166 [Chytridiales sp. JEL 0842]|nr:hypothetical protein HDV05_001166 [Chytridiales sp. JEL 0842]